jgi:hypothetical protein
MGVWAEAIWSNSAFLSTARLQISSPNITFFGMRDRSTMRAASGSNQKLNSAAGEALPGHPDVAAHEDNLLDLRFDLGFQTQRQRDIRHRPDGQNGQLAGVALDLGNQECRGAFPARFSVGERGSGRGLHRRGVLGECAGVARDPHRRSDSRTMAALLTRGFSAPVNTAPAAASAGPGCETRTPRPAPAKRCPASR